MECGFGWTEAKVPLGAGWEVRPGQVVESVSSGLRPVALGKYGTIPREAQLDKVTGSGTRCAFKEPCCPQRRLLILQIRPNLSEVLLLILPSSFHYLDHTVKIKSCRLSNSGFLIGMADIPIPC